MPVYEYEPTTQASCVHCQGGFERLQRISEEALSACPACGAPCKRVLSLVSVSKTGSDILSPTNLARKGFTQYKRAGDGVYTKTAGSGPDTIQR